MNHHPQIVVAGSGRSGTTWVLDAIARANGFRTIFEPLHPLLVPEAAPFANQYISENTSRPELESFISRVFSGQIQGLWVDRRINPVTLYPSHFLETLNVSNKGFSIDSTKRYLGYWKKMVGQYFYYRHQTTLNHCIVKFIRANLMLGWLKNRFDVKIIFLMRHPGAVVESKLRSGSRHWPFQPLIERYLSDRDLQEDFLHPYANITSGKMSGVTGQTILWCIENIVPLNINRDHIYPVYYENLVAKPEVEWPALISWAGLTEIPNVALLNRPSSQTKTRKAGVNFDISHLGNWKRRLSRSEINDIDHVLRAFNVKDYSAYETLPLK